MHQGEGQVGQLPPQILADQKAPPGSGGAPHYYLPPRIFDPWCIPGYHVRYLVYVAAKHTVRFVNFSVPILKYNELEKSPHLPNTNMSMISNYTLNCIIASTVN